MTANRRQILETILPSSFSLSSVGFIVQIFHGIFREEITTVRVRRNFVNGYNRLGFFNGKYYGISRWRIRRVSLKEAIILDGIIAAEEKSWTIPRKNCTSVYFFENESKRVIDSANPLPLMFF